MQLTAVTGNIKDLKFDAHILGIFHGDVISSGVSAFSDPHVDQMITPLFSSGEISGKFGKMTLVHTYGKIEANHILVIGLGKSDAFNPSVLRKAIAQACRYLRNLGVTSSASISLPAVQAASLTIESLSQSIAEGIILGLYKYRNHITKEPDSPVPLTTFAVLGESDESCKSIAKGLLIGKIVAEATNLARDWSNEPANYMTPTIMATIASELAHTNGIEAEILNREECEVLGMGGFLGVARGSQEEPKFIILRYAGDPEDKENNLGLIGKSVTFDSGGISLKPAAGMGDMKGDMSGGAAVIAAIQAIAQLKPKINVIAIAAATENLPSGTATKPGDVLKTITGKTVEVENTDAEGRLTLADALGYAHQQGIRRLVDVATLTGAIVTSLGNVRAGIFGNNQKLIDAVIAAGEETGERMWQFPMDDEYKELNKSAVADLKNTGGRTAGSITAAQFLAEFATESEWAHLDIAGVFRKDKDSGEFVKGATGIPVRCLINLAIALAK